MAEAELKKDEVVRLFALGGLDEDGKNLMVIEINGDMYIVECGHEISER